MQANPTPSSTAGVRLFRVGLSLMIVMTCMSIGACGGNSKKTTASSTSSSSSSSSSSSAAPGPTAVLTGLALSDENIRKRTLLVVKIDNHPEARPQFGIDKADVIVEEKVEGGVSRFMALFQSQDSDRVGPVRSLRSTDVEWLKPEGGMIAYSGGIDPVKAELGPAGITDIGGDNHGPRYYKRRSDRPFEHSMYTMTPVLRELTPKDAPAPKPLFQFLGPGQTFGGAGVAPVGSVSLRMNALPTATAFDWTWNAQKGMFLRGTDGKAHDIEGVGQIAMKNVIIQFTDYRNTPWRDRANSPVDEAVVTGSNDIWVLSDGKIVKGRWNRPSDRDITSFVDSTGAVIKLQPGQTWISMVPPGQFSEIH